MEKPSFSLLPSLVAHYDQTFIKQINLPAGDHGGRGGQTPQLLGLDSGSKLATNGFTN